MSHKVLIIDDEVKFCEMVKERLEANGYEVIVSNDGQSGIIRAQEDKPDIILMDLMMPNMSGADAVSILKSDSDINHIPIIFLTAVVSSHEEGGDQTVNINGTFYPAIAKPFKPEEFLSKVVEVLGQ